MYKYCRGVGRILTGGGGGGGGGGSRRMRAKRARKIFVPRPLFRPRLLFTRAIGANGDQLAATSIFWAKNDQESMDTEHEE